MSKLQVIQLSGDNIYTKETSLRQASSVVTLFDDDFQKEVDNLIETFYSWKIAVGLSAPQVGLQKRIAIINMDKSKPQDTLVIVNPEIQSESGKKDIKKESCLSIPGCRGEVERRHKIHITYQDRFGIRKQIGVEGFLARIFMHEIDHLNGILFVDRMTSQTKLEPLDIEWE
ncbi:peptide deformylase [Limnovirga soli]|uniref:Peptide deformylase n=1 Tax=Limnovirga soli TaxID=2656915 RepID=A0A8J8FC82_9BACT|nr:peptide deformylase [Limnovirga soli]NNV53873.1 peptide deformylase [Limnovirga soli]